MFASDKTFNLKGLLKGFYFHISNFDALISDFKEVFVIEKDAKRHLKFLKKRKKQLEKKLNDLASSKTLATDNARINFIFSFVRISSVYHVLV